MRVPTRIHFFFVVRSTLRSTERAAAAGRTLMEAVTSPPVLTDEVFRVSVTDGRTVSVTGFVVSLPSVKRYVIDFDGATRTANAPLAVAVIRRGFRQVRSPRRCDQSVTTAAGVAVWPLIVVCLPYVSS